MAATSDSDPLRIEGLKALEVNMHFMTFWIYITLPGYFINRAWIAVWSILPILLTYFVEHYFSCFDAMSVSLIADRRKEKAEFSFISFTFFLNIKI